MKKESISKINLLKTKSLRSYITLMITGIITLSLVISGILFYHHTASTLKNTYQDQMLQQLNISMSQIDEQVNLIDSLYMDFMSNNFIYDALESNSPETINTTAIEKQMTYLLITNYVWKEKFIDFVTIHAINGNDYHISTSDYILNQKLDEEIYQNTNKSFPSLRIVESKKTPSEQLFFVRNIFSLNTGHPIATMIIAVDKHILLEYLSSSLNNSWSVHLYNNDLTVSSFIESPEQLNSSDYLTVSKKLDNLDLYAMVVAPKQELQEKLASSLQIYLSLIVIIIFCVLFFSFACSKAITYPITRMTRHINRITEGHYDETIPVTELYNEFNTLTLAFNHMLNEISTYHADNLEKQLLLKNAEIQALQSQINPHFLFNTLNTLAWKAQMSDNPELYQMTISLGELLKTNVLSKSSTCFTLQEEIKYIKFYIYLQKMRFEDKINVDFQIDPGLDKFLIPCFSIQCLVENAFVHGLEPKKGNGNLTIIIKNNITHISILVEDNGIGFSSIPEIKNVQITSNDSHTHIGLSNLDRRLFLLYGEDYRLKISSTPNVITSVSFKLPFETEALL